MSYATISDITTLKRPLTASETSRATALIPIVESALRYEAEKVGKDLDLMIEASADLEHIVKSVVVDIVMRELMTSTSQEPMTQYSESANGYSVSGSFLVPGGGLFVKKSELARLGLRRQKIGVIDLWEAE